MADFALVGRDAEAAVLDGLVDEVAERGGALVVRGDPGIGKSCLLAEGAKRAAQRGMRVLATSGVQCETHLAFAGLHQLLRPVLAHAEGLPATQRDALLAAFGISGTAAPERFVIALAALDLLGDAAAERPLVLVAEDAQWLDRPTADALAFIARRLSADPIVLLIAVRDSGDDPFEAAGLPALQLAPLGDQASGHVLDAQDPDLEPAVRAKVLKEAGGNPLALVELPLALASDTGEAKHHLPDHLPLTTRLERAFAARLPGLPAVTRTLLLVAAAEEACAPADVLPVTAAILGAAIDAAALKPAISAGLVTVTSTEIRFRHPLVRSAVYQSASFDERLAVHSALAEALSAEPDRAVWHRAASTLGPDEVVAAALEAAAARARRQGGTAVAVAALQRAAELSVTPPDRARRLLRAVQLAFELGRHDLAVPLLAKADPLKLTPLQRGRLRLIREMVHPQPFVGAASSLIDAAQLAAGEGDTDLALDLLWLVASRAWWKDPGAAARQVVVTAVERIDSIDGDPRVLSMLGYIAPFQRGAAVVSRLADARAEELSPESARLLGTAAVVSGAWNFAPPLLAASVAGLRAQGRLGHLPRVLVMQALVAAYLADWNIAVPAAEEARALAAETGQPIWAGAASSASAVAAAMRGEVELAEAHAADAERIATPYAAAHVLALAQIARGAAALGAGQHLQAFQHLRRLFQPHDPAFHWTMRWWGLADFVEAALRAGNRPAAEALIAEFEPLAARTPAFWTQAMLRQAGTLLAPNEEAEPLFQEALSAELQRWALPRGRLLLGYGEWLRRNRRVAESRAPLRAARETFDAAGAIAWGERARRELRASGETSQARTPESRNRLTPQELQIAQLAADGLTNREIGHQLYLSHRTVGSHLYRIFPKLGVSSRAQLRAVVGQ